MLSDKFFQFGVRELMRRGEQLKAGGSVVDHHDLARFAKLWLQKLRNRLRTPLF
jgi:hypothetical protein